MDIAEMAALGKFEHEFIVYGCCYQMDRKYYYKVSTQSTDIYRFKKMCLEQNIYTTPVMEWLNRIAVPSGMKEEYLGRTKIQLAKKLQQIYRNDIFERFTDLAKTNNNDAAADLLYELQKKVMGYFDKDIMQLIEGIIIYAYQQKKLTTKTYNNFCQWLSYIYKQMEDDMIITKAFRRTFFGFAYRDQEKTRYYANASEGEAQKRREEFIIRGYLCTPMVQNKYYFDNQPDLSVVRKQFLQQLEDWMDNEYWQYITTIDQLPTVIDTNDYEQLFISAEERNLSMVKRHLQYYKCLWNI